MGSASRGFQMRLARQGENGTAPAAAPGWAKGADKAGQRNHFILTVDHSRGGGSRRAVRDQMWGTGHHSCRSGAQVPAASPGTVTVPPEPPRAHL